MNTDCRPHIDIVGAGLAGCLLATLLAQRGWRVDVYEKRGDPSVEGYRGGRSINLTIAERGRHALRLAGIEEAVMARTVMMRGRMIHRLGAASGMLRYGRDDSEVIWSINRGELNAMLLAAARDAGAAVHFHRQLQWVDFDARIAGFADARGGAREIRFDSLVGADGAGSALRAAMMRFCDLGERSEILDHSYKELEIPPADDGGSRLDLYSLHVWTRGRAMCIALPNRTNTFTVNLMLPNQGESSFARIRTAAQARALFERDFPDALPLIPRLEQDFESNPTGVLVTRYLDRWHVDGRAVVLGDAAHAMVPFHGQGMNCAFEDCVALVRCLQTHADRGVAFAQFQAERVANAHAIQAMALENYFDIRDRADDRTYLLQRSLEHVLARRHPQRFVPRYSLVTFHRVPYRLAFERGRVQRELLNELVDGKSSLDALDWSAVDAAVRERLPELSLAN
ncbi:FAD-dependent oxidoreductase [Pseudomonas sp. CGJS7]|uniref:FAD-dependent oxidoreductase n=1 Tax=Pseudomonas sp. CGJS7 TaxID=3109348 RepID=UPI00300BBF4F